MLLIVIITLAFIPLIFLILPKHGKDRNFNPPPGPKGLPLIGNLHQFDPSAPHLYLSKLAKTYGPILALHLGCKPTVVIQSAKLAKEVLKTQDHNFCSRPPLVGQQRLSYNGLDIAFTPYDDYFREIRKTCFVHFFSSKRVQSFAPVRRDEVSRMIEKVSSLSAGSESVNLSDLLSSLTSSILCRTAFGKRYEDEGIERTRSMHSNLREAEAMLTALYFSDCFPLIGRALDKLTGRHARLERVFKALDEFYEEIIDDHLNENKPEHDQEDIVDVLLRLRKECSFAFEITLDNIKAVLMNKFIAGTDTSAAMVVWAMTELIKNPTVMIKAQEELRTVCRGKSSIEEEDLPKLQYLKAVMKETFRLHPSVPLLLIRGTLQECNVEGYDIQAKALVFVNAWSIGRDPECWENPETFMPERFLGSNSSVDFKGNHFELIPFGAGRRICPGITFGTLTFELALANLLYSFVWELPDGMNKEHIDTDGKPGIIMHKKNPLCLAAKRIT